MPILTNIWKALRKFFCNSLIPFIPFNRVRIWGYRFCGFKIGKGVFIGMHCYLDDTYPHRLVVEDKVTVSFRVTFACHGPRTRDHRLILKKGSYIGCSSTLLGGLKQGDITIGPYATVGACSLVTTSIAPLATVAGVPAKLFRTQRQPWESDGALVEHLHQTYLAPPPSPPVLQPTSGPYSFPLAVKVMTELSYNQIIRYTTDGTEPTEECEKLESRLLLQTETILKIRLYQAGKQPSKVETYNFCFENSDVHT